MELPKDIFKKLVYSYFSPREALISLRLNKQINGWLDRYKIIERVLRDNMEKKFQEKLDQLIVCDECQTVLQDNHSLNIHKRKHKRLRDKGKEMAVWEPLTTWDCSLCGLIRCNHLKHECFNGEIVNCYAGLCKYPYDDWCQSLCEKFKWFRKDPAYLRHVCTAKCDNCKEIFPCFYFHPDYSVGGRYNGYEKHLSICPGNK